MKSAAPAPFLPFLLLLLGAALWGCRTPTPPPVAGPFPLPSATIIPLNPPDFATLAPPAAVIARVTATPLPSPTPPAAPTPELRRHTVVAGDSAWSIAARHALTLDELLALNPGLRPELLAIGQELLLPPAETLSAGSAAGEIPLPTALEIATLRLVQTPAGSWWVLGEVRNAHSQPVADLRVTVTISGQNAATGSAGNGSTQNGVAVTAHAWVQPGLVAAGSQAPFAVLLPELPPPPHAITAAISAGQLVRADQEQRLVLDGRVVALTQTENRVAWQAELHNSGELAVDGVRVVLICRDGDGQLVGFGEVWPEGGLAAGARVVISADLILPVSGAQVIGYDLVTQGTITHEARP